MLLIRPLRAVYRTLSAAGAMWVWTPPVELCGPAPGHPERLRPDVPFDATELALFRQLTALRD
ncbi:DUF6059 family protein [Streptomyces sp. NRRL S-87]|uniref:DUF6059 family protein n=1 Tax=Streptomyces sp. NRRL S-87 TaxID=1463920 RepID=UPI00068A90FF|nr:DUF6059 family protein [Streptomyces sp. NRRL S-87]